MILKNKGSNKCLDDSGNSNAGTMPWMWDCNASNVNQKWRVNGGYWKPYWTDILHQPE